MCKRKNPTATLAIPEDHAELKIEHARQRAQGELQAGWWKWEWERSAPWYKDEWRAGDPTITFISEFLYRYKMTNKHPEYLPKLKFVDLQRLPHGAHVLLVGSFRPFWIVEDSENGKSVVYEGFKHPINAYPLRITSQGNFTYWGGGDCSVPEGLVVEVVLRSGEKQVSESNELYWKHDKRSNDVIAYRILRLAEGYTDNPEEASDE